jgi:hypothetical protein
MSKAFHFVSGDIFGGMNEDRERYWTTGMPCFNVLAIKAKVFA